MAYRYTCDVCGMEMTSETEEGLIQLAKQHFKSEHGKRNEDDVTKPDLLDKEGKLRDRFEEA